MMLEEISTVSGSGGPPTIEIPPPPTPGGDTVVESGLNTPAVAGEAPKKKAKPKSKAKKPPANANGGDENAGNAATTLDLSAPAATPSAAKEKDGDKNDKGETKSDKNEKAEKPEKPEKTERDENATSNLNKKRGPLLTKLNILEQQHFLARKGYAFRAPRSKAHWDYTLEEAQWMAVDFRQELRWKVSLSRALAYACKESMEERASLFYQLRKLSIKNAHSEETVRAKSVAKKISNVIKTTWKEWQSKLEQKANLLLKRKEESLSTSRSAEKHLSPEQIETTIETILSIPSIVHSNSVPCNFPLPPFDTMAPKSSSSSSSSSPNIFDSNSNGGNTICKMMEHQELIYREILRLNQIGFGAMVYGTSYSGKTVSIGHALIFGLLEELKIQKSMMSTSSASPTICGIVVATQHGIWHWLLVFHQYCHPYVDVKVWNDEEDDNWLKSNYNKDRRDGFPLIILVPIEKFDVFKENKLWLALNQIDSALGSNFDDMASSSSPSNNNELMNQVKLGGLVVDLRGSQKQNPHRQGVDVSMMMSGHAEESMSASLPGCGSSMKYSDQQSHYQILATLSNYLPSHFTKRILITDDNFRVIERISTLSYLIPGIPYHLLYQRFNFEPSSSTNSFVLEVYKKNPESQIIPLEQINKNTLHQLLINLSIHAMIPGDRNTRAYAQIREEINYVELTPSQQRKYDDITSVLVRSGFYTGADIEKLTRILALLKLICFHSDFATIKKIPTVMNMMHTNSSSYLTYKPSVTKSTQLSNDNPGMSSSLMSIFFSQGSLVSKLGHVSHLYHNIMPSAASIDSSYAPTPSTTTATAPPNYGVHTKSDDPGELLMQGSNKLRALKGLLQRFSGLRVVVVASHWMEISLIHQFLELQGIEHIYPHLYLKYGQQSTVATNWNFPNNSSDSNGMNSANGSGQNPFSEIPNMEKLFWLAQESNIQLFNDPSVLSCILLTTYHAFQSPSTSPWLADAVILLSHHWESYYDLKNCFRMRLLHTGPQGDPVTIVRVCSKSTVEEVICKQKVGIPQLQGYKLSDLYFHIKDNTSQLNANNLTGTTTSSDFDSGLTTMPFLRSAPSMPSIKSGQSIHNIFGSHNSNNSLFSLVHSPMGIENPASNYSKTANFFNERSNIIGGLPLESDSQNNSGNESNSSAPTLVRRKSGGGKGMIVLGPQGKTQFVKEPGTGNGSSTGNSHFSAYAWSSARSGILSALYTLDEEQHKTDETKSEKQLTFQWLQTFHNNIQQALCELSSVPFSTPAPPPPPPAVMNNNIINNANVSMNNSITATAMELCSLLENDDAAEKKSKLLTGVYEMVVYQTYYILQNRARNMIQPVNEQITAWKPKCEMSINVYFLETVYKLLSSTQPTLSDPTEDILDIAMKIEASSDDENKITKNMEKMKLNSLGIGISDHQACIAKNFFVAPNTKSANYVSVKETVTDEDGVITPYLMTNSGGLAKSAVFTAFKDTVQEMMFNGTIVDPWLFVNPLQTASKFDQVRFPSYTSAWDREDLGVKVKYVHKGMQVKPPAAKKATKANASANNATAVSNEANSEMNIPNDGIDSMMMLAGGMSTANSFRDLESASIPVDDMMQGTGVSNKKRKTGQSSAANAALAFINPASISVDLQDSMIAAGQSLTNDGMWNDDVGMIVDDDLLTGEDLAASGNILGSTSLQHDVANTFNMVNEVETANQNKRLKNNMMMEPTTSSAPFYQPQGSSNTNRYSYGSNTLSESSANNATGFPGHATSNTNFHTNSMSSSSGFAPTVPPTTTAAVSLASGPGTVDNTSSSYFYGSSATTYPSGSSNPTTDKSTVPTSNTNFGSSYFASSSATASVSNATVGTGGASAVTASTNGMNVWNGPQLLNQNLSPHLSTALPAGSSSSTNGTVTTTTTSSSTASYFPYAPHHTTSMSQPNASFILPPVSSALASSNKTAVVGTTASVASTGAGSGSTQAVLLGGGPIAITPGNQITTAGNVKSSILPATSNLTSSSVSSNITSSSSTASSSDLNNNDTTTINNAAKDSTTEIGASSASSAAVPSSNSTSGASASSTITTTAPTSSSATVGNSNTKSSTSISTSTLLPSPSITPGTEDAWLPVEDDIMICMQNATNDPNFVYTIHWLNNAKGISRTSPRTEAQARTRYNFLCQSGKRDTRLSDPNVIRTIAKLRKSMKRQSNTTGAAVSSTSSSTVMSSNAINSSSTNHSSNTLDASSSVATSSAHIHSSSSISSQHNNSEASKTETSQ